MYCFLGSQQNLRASNFFVHYPSWASKMFGYCLVCVEFSTAVLLLRGFNLSCSILVSVGLSHIASHFQGFSAAAEIKKNHFITETPPCAHCSVGCFMGTDRSFGFTFAV